ncbi:DUF1801 domain-containing protein [Scleromatobacter humisilvae]|uniref:DUF1801 domain-containing protein n=1 Tax=Scleromatobacter humisilvae TaxID=2897159 RepID=A0A9X2BXM0_9BURK|nr:DUF1801 domain-containing protein [Scleromatobacter humisilvae]MCK9684723.1 DUF1801 domain-containing protein [Scleromatobacter humisilvae]
MQRLFRFPAAARRDPAVAAWFDTHPGELGALARHWFDVLRASGDDIHELLHDGQPTACVGDAAFAYVDAFTGHVNLGFFHGNELTDPAALLQGAGRFMRHVKLVPGREVDDAALRRLIADAHADMQTRQSAQRPPCTGTGRVSRST